MASIAFNPGVLCEVEEGGFVPQVIGGKGGGICPLSYNNAEVIIMHRFTQRWLKSDVRPLPHKTAN